MLLDEKLQTIDNTSKIISTAFNKAYKYALSNPTIKLSSFVSRKLEIVDDMDDVFAQLLALMTTAKLHEKKIDETDIVYVKLIESFYNLNNISDGIIKLSFSYGDCDKARKALISELELILRGKYFPNGYNQEAIHMFLEVKKCFGESHERDLNIDIVKNDIYCKMFCAIEYADNIFNKSSSMAILKDIKIKREVILDFISAYLIFNGHNIEDRTKIDKNDINIDELATFVAISLSQVLYLEAYSNTYDFFFDNYNESIDFKYKELLDKEKEVRSENLTLQDNLQNVLNENDELRRRISKLESELQKSQSNNKELFELRSYIFNNQDEYKDYTAEELDINLEHLEGKKIVCFGGNASWISSMSKEFNDWIFVSAESINFDPSILKDSDLVVIKATHISHAMYYRIMANLNENTAVKFINNTNVSRVKKELSVLDTELLQ